MSFEARVVISWITLHRSPSPRSPSPSQSEYNTIDEQKTLLQFKSTWTSQPQSDIGSVRDQRDHFGLVSSSVDILFNWISLVSSFVNDMLWTPSWFQVQCHVAIPDPSVACQLLKSSKSYQQSATGRPEGATTTTDYNSPTRSVSSFQMFLSHWRAANLDRKPILHKPSLACETKPRQMNPRLLRTSPLWTALRLLTFGIGLSINASGWLNYVDLHLTMYAAKSWASSWQS